tara:strand:- start:45897 stop:46172 length:276 start_codon:yes stop_codon:yes gene_type:complete
MEDTQNGIMANEARVNITWAGSNGDMAQPVATDATDAEIKEWAAEAVRTGSVPGLNADENVDFSDFVVDRFASTEVRPYSLISLRPKSPFG